MEIHLFWDERDDFLAIGHPEYQSWCELCVTEVLCKDVQQRCWIAGKKLVSDVMMSDVTSIIDVEECIRDEIARCAERVRGTTSEPSGVIVADAVVEKSVRDT